MSGDFGVAKPDYTHRFGQHGCWALVLMRGTGSMFRSVDNCGNKARPDKLTCQRHNRFEAKAQKKKGELKK
jgi:hypothetical protein